MAGAVSQKITHQPEQIPNYFEAAELGVWRCSWEQIAKRKNDDLENLFLLSDLKFEGRKTKHPKSGRAVHRLTNIGYEVVIREWPKGLIKRTMEERSKLKIQLLKKAMVWRMKNDHIERASYGVENDIEFIAWCDPYGVEVLTLDQLIDGDLAHGATEEVVCGVLQNIAWCLAILHSKGVVHWDVTTSTIRQYNFPGLKHYKLGGNFEKLQRTDLRRMPFEDKVSPTYSPPGPVNDANRSTHWDIFALGMCLIQLARGLTKEEAYKEWEGGKIGPTPNLSTPLRNLILRMLEEKQPSLISIARGLDEGDLSKSSEW